MSMQYCIVTTLRSLPPDRLLVRVFEWGWGRFFFFFFGGPLQIIQNILNKYTNEKSDKKGEVEGEKYEVKGRVVAVGGGGCRTLERNEMGSLKIQITGFG